MKLHAKLILSLLSGLLAVFIISQIAQAFLSNGRMEKLSNENLALLEKREKLRVDNIYQTANPIVTDFIEHGEMGKLEALMCLYTNTDGLLEYSLYNNKGVVSYSSNQKVLKSRQTLPIELRLQLFGGPSKIARTTSDAFEIYQPIAITAKCVECHENFKPGDIGCITALRVSTDTMVQSKQSWNASLGRLQAMSLTSATVTTLLIVVVFILLAYALVKRMIATPLSRVINRLEGASHMLVGATAQFQSSSQNLAEGATEQAATLEQSSAALQQMTSMTSKTLDLAQKAKDLTNHSKTIGDAATTDMQEMKAAMDAIKGSSDEIAKILKTIDEIAFQTNILALNAAVEAARAGESGLGFAVVANEVRTLAQRCASAAHEIETKIEDSKNKGAHGVEISGKVANSLMDIVDNARQVDQFVMQVSRSAKEQNQGIEQINAAVHQMDQVTQSNAASAEETASAATELTAQSQAIDNAIGELELLVNGSNDKQDNPVKKVKRPSVHVEWEPANREQSREVARPRK